MNCLGGALDTLLASSGVLVGCWHPFSKVWGSPGVHFLFLRGLPVALGGPWGNYAAPCVCRRASAHEGRAAREITSMYTKTLKKYEMKAKRNK